MYDDQKTERKPPTTLNIEINWLLREFQADRIMYAKDVWRIWYFKDFFAAKIFDPVHLPRSSYDRENAAKHQINPYVKMLENEKLIKKIK